jgi:predicted nucleic acid-binding protein
LTNRQVMQRAVLSQSRAWDVYLELARDERILFVHEPEGVEERWRELTRKASPSTGLWTDCYLQALAELAGLRVVTFDRRFSGSARSDALTLG